MINTDIEDAFYGLRDLVIETLKNETIKSGGEITLEEVYFPSITMEDDVVITTIDSMFVKDDMLFFKYHDCFGEYEDVAGLFTFDWLYDILEAI